MNKESFRAHYRSVLLVACALLALAGCSANHIGETWQCPIAQGAQCTSVAGADPAIPRAISGESLASMPVSGSRTTAATQNRACTGLCRPFAWFSRLFTDTESAQDLVSGDGLALAADLPVDPASGEESRPIADVRLPEKIGRVWIAPWVDGDGVYREGAWVRIVIRPAAWRIP